VNLLDLNSFALSSLKDLILTSNWVLIILTKLTSIL